MHAGAVAFTNAYFGQGTGPIWLDNLRCSGNQLNLRQCPRNNWGSHNCRHSEDAGVRCPRKTLYMCYYIRHLSLPPSLSLSLSLSLPLSLSLGCYEGNVWLPGGNTWREGTVEICHNGVWSTVCDDRFGTNEAKVVCSMLGYDTAGMSVMENNLFLFFLSLFLF